jgi:hypothetical protein
MLPEVPTPARRWLTKANSSHHSARANAFAPIREEQIFPASGAVCGRMNCGRLQPASNELSVSHSREIEVQCGSRARMTRRSLSVKEPSVTVRPPRFGALGRLAKEGFTFDKLAGESFHHFLSNLVAAGPDARSENRHLVSRFRIKDAPYLADTLLDDSGERSAPAGMNRRYHPESHINDQHGQAIGNTDRQQDATISSQQGIAGRVFTMGNSRTRLLARKCRQGPACGAIVQGVRACASGVGPQPRNLVNQGRVDLLQACYHRRASERRIKELSITLNLARLGARGQPQVEITSLPFPTRIRITVGGYACAESVREPGETRERR